MLLNKHNKYDAYNKIIKCIQSCETIKHLNCCENMVNTFNDIYNDEDLTSFLVNIGSNKLIKIKQKHKKHKKQIGYVVKDSM